MVLGLVAAEQLVGRLVLNQPSGAASTPSAQRSPSSTSSSSHTPPPVVVDLRPVLIKPTDLRAGYVVQQTGSKPLCPKCVPQVSSLAVQLQNNAVKRTILSAASIAPSPGDTKTVAAALRVYLGASRVAGRRVERRDADFAGPAVRPAAAH